ncbi:MAG: hypothetical protein SPF17_05540 [Candidatus Mucispirillum faecigallinarum]|nr:hypothetical protein [Candidatus Mucispirillum faecigallinarum]
MGFPKQVNSSMAIGKPGEKASDNPVSYVAGQTVAGSNGCFASRFAWITAGQTKDDIYNPATFANTGTGKPDGLVEALTLQSIIDNINSDNTMIIPAGYGVNIAQTGDYFVVVSAGATVGQKVFANLTDGSIKTASAGATVAGYVETDWTAATGADSAGVIIISNR